MGIAKKIFNKIIKEALPIINRKIAQAIQKQGLDPYQSVYHYEISLGKIEIFEQSVEAKASINLGNLRGLSSVEIANLKFSNVDAHPFSNEDTHATGDFTIDFKHDLSTDIDGSVTATIKTILGSHSERESIDAHLTNSETSVKANASFTFGSLTDIEIKDIHINTLSVDIGKSTVHFDGELGIFNKYLDDLIESATNKFQEELQGHVIAALKMAIQKGLDAALPMTLN